MLSKSKGQILRVAAVLHVLFQIDSTTAEEEVIPEDTISLKALKAAIDFTSTSIQHAAYIAGRTVISTEVELAEAGNTVPTIAFEVTFSALVFAGHLNNSCYL